MCEDCRAKAHEARTVVDAVVHAEKHARVLYPNDSNEQHAVRLAMVILETQAAPREFDGMPALSVETLQCLAMQYATVVQRLIALYEVAGIPIP